MAIVLKILNKALTPKNPVINEIDLHKLVTAAADQKILKTRQDPWHIFRYYRTELVKRGALKQISPLPAQGAPAA